MSLGEYRKLEITDCGGLWSRLEPTDVPVPHALLANNCEFAPGQVSTRRGFGAVFNPNEAITSLYNWVRGADGVSTAGNSLVYYASASGKVRMVNDLSSPSPVDLFTQAGAAGAFIASGGSRLYVATFTSAIAGAGQLRVVGVYGAALNTDKAFLGPITTKPTLSNLVTAGNVTQGTHRVGYVIKTRNGFTGKICPVTASGDFDTTSSITAPGGKQIRMVVNPPAWPAEASSIEAVITPVTNLNRFFVVPGSEMNVPGGGALSVTIDIDLSDDDMFSEAATEITDNRELFTQASDGTGPFNPFAVIEYGSRMVYLTTLGGISQAYASEPEKHQTITADEHVLYLPGFRQMTAGFANRGTLYICGPHWTYATEDTGGTPSEWPTPKLVDGTIGAPAPRCVTVNASQGFALVAHPTGFWLFSGGAYQTRPLSYFVEPEWKRINWNYAHQIQVLDNKDRQQAYVIAPLDSATAPSHILMFDYSNGLTPESVKFSLWNLASYNPGAGALVQSPSTKQLELWLGNSSAGKVLRHMVGTADATPYNDDSAAIDFQYETCLLPGMNASMGTVYGHYACQLRVKGAGTLNVTTYGVDRTKNVTWTALTLAASPGKEYTKRFARINSEGVSHRFRTNAANEYAILSALEHYYAPWIGYR